MTDLGMQALGGLIPIGALCGVAMLAVFRRTSDQAAVRRVKNLIVAYLLEFRLFMDAPRLILRAQRKLILANFRWIGLMLKAIAVLTIPMAVLLAQLDAIYGHGPLRVGEPAVVTAQLKDAGVQPVLGAAPGIAVETPPVHVIRENRVSWRIRPLSVTRGVLRIASGDRVLTKSIVAAPGLGYLSGRRTGSIQAFLLHPAELPFKDPHVAWIEIQYPRATILHVHWLIWFFAIAAVSAPVFRRNA